MTTFRPWEQAWQEALYGERGFYRLPEGPAGHFRTAAHASTTGLLAGALSRLARLTGCTAVLDVGAGRGELLRAVHAADPDLRCAGVDVVDRPPQLPAEVGWSRVLPLPTEPTLLVAWELLDVVPTPVLQVDDDGTPRVVEVSADGAERLGAPATPEDLAWCRRWWPPGPPGSRIEVGRTRDATWSRLVDALSAGGGLALAADYGHDSGRRPVLGSLTGYARGAQVAPVPDGSCDVTAHVALDAVAAVRAGGFLARQRDALRGLGVSSARPALELASTDPTGYLRGLSAAGEAAELLDPHSLGGFGWVLHPVGETCSRAVAGAVRRWTADAPA